VKGKKAGDEALSHAEFASPRGELAWIMVVGRRPVCRASHSPTLSSRRDA
jgi:hypothetical protein